MGVGQRPHRMIGLPFCDDAVENLPLKTFIRPVGMPPPDPMGHPPHKGEGDEAQQLKNKDATSHTQPS